MGRLAALVLAFLGLLLLPADGAAGRRVALVIGNGSYEAAGTLANPVNDATDMAAKLRAVGFEVIEGHDLGKRALERKIGDFSDALNGAAVGLFFYSGHGLQVDGRNFIVPTDARLDVPAKLRLEAVPMDDVLDIMEQQAPTSLVFLDACRNNPFARSLAPSSNRSAVALGGLAQFDAARGSFIAFSTAPGAVAMDGSGRNSPFASALLKHIGEPGQSINDLMISVRRDVIAETHDFQRPWEQGSLVERFEFVPAGGTATAEVQAPAAQPQPPAAPAMQLAAQERSVGDDGSVEVFVRERYLAPQPGRIEQDVRALYADKVTIYGVPLALDAIVKAKGDWFAKWSGWSLALVPGSLEVKPRGEDGADVRFAMTYDYAPADRSAAHAAGKARVALSLHRQGGDWRVTAETSEAMP